MKKQTFIMGALILTIGGFIAKIIGAFYKIPLTNALGTEGMGIYYLVFPLYSVLLVLSSSGISIAVSKLVSEARANKQKRNETMYFKAGIFLSFVSSAIFAIFLIVFSEKIASIQGNMFATKSYIAIAPALVSASLISVVKGYFQGVENMFPSSVALIFEQIIKLIVGLFLAYKFLEIGIEYAVLGSVLAVSISEFVTLVVMLINYAWHKAKNDYKFYVRDEQTLKLKQIEFRPIVKKCGNYKIGKLKHYKKKPIWIINLGKGRKKRIKIKVLYFYSSNKLISFKSALKSEIKVLVPNTLSSLVIPIMTLFDSFVVINMLISVGISPDISTSLYGLSNGVVSALVSLPVIITSALASSTMPNLAGLYSVGRVNEVGRRCAFYIKITFVIILPIFIFFVLFSNDLISLLYNFSDNPLFSEYSFACRLLKVASVGIIYNAFLSTFVSIMQVLGQSFRVFYYMLISLVLRVVALLALLKITAVNIFAVIISNILFYLICDILCVIKIKSLIDLNFNFGKTFCVPIISMSISGAISFLVSLLIKNINKWLYLGINGVVCIVVYVGMIIALKCFSQNEKSYFPFPKNTIALKTRYK